MSINHLIPCAFTFSFLLWNNHLHPQDTKKNKCQALSHAWLYQFILFYFILIFLAGIASSNPNVWRWVVVRRAAGVPFEIRGCLSESKGLTDTELVRADWQISSSQLGLGCFNCTSRQKIFNPPHGSNLYSLITLWNPPIFPPRAQWHDGGSPTGACIGSLYVHCMLGYKSV